MEIMEKDLKDLKGAVTPVTGCNAMNGWGYLAGSLLDDDIK